jgi:hypothetical protein
MYCHGFVFGLVSLLKLVIIVCQSSGICEYSTYGLTLIVSVIKFSHAMFNSVVFMMEDWGILCLVLEKPLVVSMFSYDLTITVAWWTLYRYEHIAYPDFDGSTIRSILVGHEFLFGHSLCCVEWSVGFTCSLEVTICYTKLMQLITMLRIIGLLLVTDYNKAPMEWVVCAMQLPNPLLKFPHCLYP